MLSTDSALITALSDSTSIKAVPKLVLEYNMNEMAGKVQVTTSSTQPPMFAELFPKESIVESFRPSKAGIKYAILGQPNTMPTYKTKTIPATRVYMPDKKNPYTLFVTQGNASVTVNYQNSSGSAPQNILTNKISVRVETSYSSGTITIGSYYTGAVPSNGIVDIWLQAGGTWSTVQPTTFQAPISISSLTVSVSGSPYVGIIEVSPKYVLDVSDRVVRAGITKDDSMNDNQLPIGMITANSASFDLSTISEFDIVQFVRGDSIVNNKVMILPNVKSTLSFVINDTYTVQQGIFYINEYTSDDYGNYSITALDAAKFLQEARSPELLIKDSSFQSILWRLLDAVGFVDYDFSKCDADILSCRYWWSNRNKTVWQAIQELCRESQTVAFIDEYGKLVFISRDKFYDKTAPISWTFRNTPGAGERKPDIISLNSKVTPTTSVAKVTYNIPMTSNLQDSSQPVWTEQAPSTLFASPYKGISGNYILYPNRGVFSDVIPTRFNSYVLVGNEIIEYDAIQFSSPEGVVDISDSGQYLELRAKHDNRLTPTGKLRIKTRNAFNTPTTSSSPVQNRDLSSKGYTASKFKMIAPFTKGSVPISTVCALNQSSDNISALAISASGNRNDVYIVGKNIQLPLSSGSSNLSSVPIFQIGTSIGFELANSSNVGIQQSSGMTFFWNEATATGYMILIYTVRSAANTDQKAEATLYKVVNGLPSVLAQVSSNIFEQSFYAIDVLVQRDGTTNNIFLNVNGETVKEEKIIDSVNSITPTSFVGLVAGGQSTAYFDYLYAVPRNTFSMDVSLSRSSGRVIANSFFKDFKFEDTSRNGQFLDEFGDVVREIYKGEAQYEQTYPVEVAATDPFAQVVGQRLGHFSGEFYVFNTSSSTIALSDGGKRDLFIYGKAVANTGQNNFSTNDKITDTKQVTMFDTQWIQTREAAKGLADFVVSQWSKSTIDLDMQVFGNPIIQVGDIVSVDYASRGFNSTTKFVVRSIDHDMSTGITTRIGLRSIYSA